MTIWRPKRLRWCSQADVVSTFQVVGREIRRKCRHFSVNGLSQADACELAGRIREQRELVRQLVDAQRVRHLLRLNKAHRRRLLELAGNRGIDARVLHFK